MRKDLFRQTHLRQLLDSAHQRDLLDEAARDRAFALIGPPAPWWQGLHLVVLALGVSLVLSGIVFFFAFNWQEMTPLQKFAGLQVVIVACLAGGAVKGFQHLVGSYLLLSAALVLGVLLAVFGQVYQTGADSYQLFGVWAVLILPWALMVPFKPLRLMWAILANLGLLLFMNQAGPQLLRDQMIYQCLVMTGLNLLLFILAELKLLTQMPRLPLWMATLVYAGIPVFIWIIEQDPSSDANLLALACWLALMVAGSAVFYYKRPDFHPVALLSLNTAFMATVWLVRSLAPDDVGMFLLSSLIVAGSVSGTITGLIKLRKHMEANNG